jgi:xylan 1,4-beta-xylosidase
VSYRNPVVPGFHPDPSICRVGDEYFLAVSSFTYFPGVPIFRSTNLVDWTQIGNALDRTSQLDLTGTESMTSGGVFAPTLRHHGGRFWMITTVMREMQLQNFFVTARDAAGPWSEPVTVDLPGIDPDIAWDDDGTCWVHGALGEIRRHRIDPSTGAVLGESERTWSGTGMQFPEAPHLFRRKGTWYLLVAEGGTERGHAASIARAPSPLGPWESCPTNPIISHRSTDRPIQNTGHADFVEATDGSWWMVLLGTRPKGYTPGWHGIGRETFLAPVDWVDGWPVPGELALEMPFDPPGPAAEPAPGDREDFDGDDLGPAWISVRRPLGTAASTTERPGWLTLHGDDGDLDGPYPTFLGRRQIDRLCRIRTLVEVDDALEAGLGLRMDEGHHASIAVVRGEVVARLRVGPTERIERRAVGDGSVVLGIDVDEHPDGFLGGPDLLRLGTEAVDGTLDVLLEVDGRYLSTEVAGGFVGRVVGLYAVGGTASFDWFDMEAP